MINIGHPAALDVFCLHFPQSMDPVSQLPSLLPRTLLLPGNEAIQVPNLKALSLPPIVPLVVNPPCTALIAV